MRETTRSIKLEVHLSSVTTEQLNIVYRAENKSGRMVYLLNRLFETDISGRRHLDSNKVYREIIGRTLHLSKRLMEVPKLVFAESPEVPYLTPLAQGGSFEEIISIKLPARESYPYAHSRSMGSQGEPLICEAIVFSLGYFIAREPRWIKEVTLDGVTLLATDYGFAVQTHETVSSHSIAARCDCIKIDDPRRNH